MATTVKALNASSLLAYQAELELDMSSSPTPALWDELCVQSAFPRQRTRPVFTPSPALLPPTRQNVSPTQPTGRPGQNKRRSTVALGR
ncbi:unnamed protein product [Gadus morhua 'NCC']